MDQATQYRLLPNPTTKVLAKLCKKIPLNSCTFIRISTELPSNQLELGTGGSPSNLEPDNTGYQIFLFNCQKQLAWLGGCIHHGLNGQFGEMFVDGQVTQLFIFKTCGDKFIFVSMKILAISNCAIQFNLASVFGPPKEHRQFLNVLQIFLAMNIFIKVRFCNMTCGGVEPLNCPLQHKSSPT